jgi:uncharacterized protein (TIGR04255 family)
MTERPADLPDFQDPPLTEVALSVQFDRLGLGLIDLGEIWALFRRDFPKVEYRPLLPPVFETFGLPSVSNGPGIRLDLVDAMDLPRVWFLDDSECELIQFQGDRFIHNWRKTPKGGEYPRYEAIRHRFLAELNTLATYVSEKGLGMIRPNQCEVTYVNTLPLRSKPFPLASFSDRDLEGAGEFEDVSLVARYLMRNAADVPIGRVTIQTGHSVSPDGQLAMALNITGRGPPREPTMECIPEFLDIARRAVVKAFVGFTNEEMHRVWQRSV